jgi:hypothetical protein
VALTIDNSAGEEIHDGSNIIVEIDHAAWVAAGQSEADGSDVRIVHAGPPLAGSSSPDFTEVARASEPGWSSLPTWDSADTHVFFSTLHAIPAGDINTEYWIYYNPATTPSTQAPIAQLRNDAVRNDWTRDSTGNLIGLNCGRLVPVNYDTGIPMPVVELIPPDQERFWNPMPFRFAPYSIQLRPVGLTEYEVHIHDQMWAIDDGAWRARLTVTGSDDTVLHDLTYGSYHNGSNCFFNDRCSPGSCCGDHIETIQINDPDGFCVTMESRGMIASARAFGCEPHVTLSDLVVSGDDPYTRNGYYDRGFSGGESPFPPGAICSTDDDCDQSTGEVSFVEGYLDTWAGASCVTPEGPAAAIETSSWCRAHSTPEANTHCYEMDSNLVGVTATTCQY